jgi:predicted ATPase
MSTARITSLKIRGYRPFRDFTAQLGALEVLVGANGSGKSALFEFLKFLRDSTYQDIPPEIIAGSIGQEIFHIPGDERFWWSVDTNIYPPYPLRYQGELQGPIGRTQVTFERAQNVPPKDSTIRPMVFMDMKGQNGLIRNEEGRHQEQKVQLKRPNQLALSTATNPALIALYNLREYLLAWRFYSSFRIANDSIRKPVPIEQEPLLREDGGNLSAVLFYLSSEHPRQFDALQSAMRAMVPGFQGLSLKARGRGEVMAFWQERDINRELSLTDLSDGILRLLCWTVLCVQPNPPTLICIDEPDQGVHPRTLPVLAGLFQKASERTQILLATHASYFLTQFNLDQIAIIRKENGASIFAKPSNSALMLELLKDFGTEELEHLHRSDELERLS